LAAIAGHGMCLALLTNGAVREARGLKFGVEETRVICVEHPDCLRIAHPLACEQILRLFLIWIQVRQER